VSGNVQTYRLRYCGPPWPEPQNRLRLLVGPNYIFRHLVLCPNLSSLFAPDLTETWAWSHLGTVFKIDAEGKSQLSHYCCCSLRASREREVRYVLTFCHPGLHCDNVSSVLLRASALRRDVPCSSGRAPLPGINASKGLRDKSRPPLHSEDRKYIVVSPLQHEHEERVYLRQHPLGSNLKLIVLHRSRFALGLTFHILCLKNRSDPALADHSFFWKLQNPHFSPSRPGIVLVPKARTIKPQGKHQIFSR
jgi:hypothetical protein